MDPEGRNDAKESHGQHLADQRPDVLRDIAAGASLKPSQTHLMTC